MKLAIIHFTSSGKKQAEVLKERLDHDVVLIGKESYRNKVKDHMSEIFEAYDGIVFVSSTGIAVRFIAPYVKDKTADPAVVVVDDLGRFSIPILSGHIGGANELSGEIARALGCAEVITTASDGRNIDSVDTFAMRNRLKIESMEDAKILTGMMVEGMRIKLASEAEYDLKYDLADEDPDGIIAVTNRTDVSFEQPSCILRPKNIFLGMGCRRNTDFEEIYSLVSDTLKENNISIDSVAKLASIDLKSDEAGLKKLAEILGCQFVTFSRAELESVEHLFARNEFVKKTVGVSSVSEASAYLLSKNIIIEKVSRNGVTLAVSEG